MQAGESLFAALPVATGEHDLGAFTRQLQRGMVADAAIRAGDDDCACRPVTECRLLSTSRSYRYWTSQPGGLDANYFRRAVVRRQYYGEKPRVFCGCLICGANLLTLTSC